MGSFFIGIAGESGVGKSTIADIVKIYLGSDVLHLSTDDLHKWERTSPQWDCLTHLNPDANNLELGDMQLQDLANGKFIYRASYNHVTGYFNAPVKLEPKPYVINEGLHAFYTDTMEKLINLKIFVDTDDILRTHWKVIRDTEQRGYKYNAVIEAINRRRKDGLQVRERQIKSADVIVHITSTHPIKVLGCKSEKVTLAVRFTYRNDSAKHNPMFGFVERFMRSLDNPGVTPISSNVAPERSGE